MNEIATGFDARKLLSDVKNGRNGQQILARLSWIEGRAMISGSVSRNELAEAFGISNGKASADIALYRVVNPNSLKYVAKSRTHVWTGQPVLKNALATYLATNNDLKVSDIPSPLRRFKSETVRALLAAKINRVPLRIDYISLRNKTGKSYIICPHALVSGRRHHVRAYDFETGTFRDFVVGRILATTPAPDALEWVGAENDKAWREKVAFILVPHAGLTAEQRNMVEIEYGMQGGKLHFRCRKALALYVAEELGLLPAIRQGKADAGVENWVACENAAEIKEAIGPA